MLKGSTADATATMARRELKLPEGDYVVLDEQGHEAFVPRRLNRERARRAAGISSADDV
jgi:hypothetical protein